MTKLNRTTKRTDRYCQVRLSTRQWPKVDHGGNETDEKGKLSETFRKQIFPERPGLVAAVKVTYR